MTKAEKAAEEYVREKTSWVGEDDLWLAEANDCKKCFLAGVEWARQNPGWVSVEDRLPEASERVLIRGDCGDWPFMDVTCRDEKGWEDVHIQTWVTHWLPLPPKPEVEE